MTKSTSDIKVKHGGPRAAGPGKKMGRPADISIGGCRRTFYIDAETWALLPDKNRSLAIRIAVKAYYGGK